MQRSLRMKSKKPSEMNTLIKIRSMDLDMLDGDPLILAYYKRNYNFQTVSKVDKFSGIPIIKNASLFIEKTEKEKSIKYPWDEYMEGFIKQYEVGIDMPFDKTYILYLIEPNPWLPSFIYDRSDQRQRQNAFKYGGKTALSFLAWEHVIRNISEFEDVFNNTTSKNSFSGFLINLSQEKAEKLADKLAPIIKLEKGKGIALYLRALKKMNHLDFSNMAQVYKILNLNETQKKGANYYFEPGCKYPLHEGEIQIYIDRINSIVEAI